MDYAASVEFALVSSFGGSALVNQPTHRPFVVVHRPDPLKHFEKNCAFVKLLAMTIVYGSGVLKVATSAFFMLGLLGFAKGW